jgi:hypothetical protein
MYPYRGQTSSPGTWAGVGGGLAFAASVTVMILAILGWAMRPPLTPAAAGDATTTNYTLNSSACAPTQVLDDACVPLETLDTGCTLGYLWPDHGVCGPTVQAPTGTACQSLCYIEDATTTACDNMTGACNGNVTESRGYCTLETDLNATIPFELLWLTVTGPINEYPVFWNYAYNCYLNVVRLFTLDMVWTTDPQNQGEVVGAFTACKDFLNATFWAERGSCLTIEETYLDPTVTPIEHYLNDTNTLQQFRLCTFLYTNAALNQSAIGQPPVKRTLAAPPPYLPAELFARRW